VKWKIHKVAVKKFKMHGNFASHFPCNNNNKVRRQEKVIKFSALRYQSLIYYSALFDNTIFPSLNIHNLPTNIAKVFTANSYVSSNDKLLCNFELLSSCDILWHDLALIIINFHTHLSIGRESFSIKSNKWFCDEKSHIMKLCAHSRWYIKCSWLRFSAWNYEKSFRLMLNNENSLPATLIPIVEWGNEKMRMRRNWQQSIFVRS
jgi:hypothetical protein